MHSWDKGRCCVMPIFHISLKTQQFIKICFDIKHSFKTNDLHYAVMLFFIRIQIFKFTYFTYFASISVLNILKCKGVYFKTCIVRKCIFTISITNKLLHQELIWLCLKIHEYLPIHLNDIEIMTSYSEQTFWWTRFKSTSCCKFCIRKFTILGSVDSKTKPNYLRGGCLPWLIDKVEASGLSTGYLVQFYSKAHSI